MDEHILRRLHHLLGEALMRANLPWWEWDIEKNRVVTNALKVTMLGYEPEDFRDVGFQAYTDLLHPDDYERSMEAMRAHLEGRAPIYQVDYRIRRADGAYTWYMDRGSIIARTPEGRPARLRGIVADLGRDFEEEARSQVLFELLREAISPCHETGQMIAVCATCQRLRVTEKLWLPVEECFHDVLSGSLSHGICPDCVRRLYPQYYEEVMNALE